MHRIVLATLSSLFLLAAGVFLLDLPDPVAVHFAADGTADGLASRAAARALAVALPALVALLLTAITWTHRRPPAGMRWSLGLPVGVVWGLGGVLLATLVDQHQLADARAAVVDPGWIAGALAVGGVVTVAASRFASLPDPAATDAAAPADHLRADVHADDTALWVGRTPPGPVPQGMAVALVLLAAGLGLTPAWWLGLVLAAVGALLAASSRFTVTIGPAGIEVAGLLGGWPRLSIPIQTVTAARPRAVRPMEFGGWGLRTTPGLGTTAVVTRTGPGLEVERTDGSRVVVGLEDSEGAAAAVGTLLDRRADAAPSTEAS